MNSRHMSGAAGIGAILLLASSVVPSALLAATRVVDPSGGGDHVAIQPALAAASPGDTVLVVAGTYRGAANRDLRFFGKSVVLRSAGGAAATIIDAEGAGRGFSLDAGETAAARVEGFTVTGAAGGAVSCVGSSPTVAGCVFVENITDQAGGAVAIDGGAPTFDGCTMVANAAAGRGGGVWVAGDANATLRSCTITGNSAGTGGGGVAVIGGSQVSIQRSIVWGNSAANTLDDLLATAGATATLACSVVDAGGSGGGGTISVGPGVISRDPHFCQPAYTRADPWADGDYGLAGNSPCLPANNACGVLIGAWPAACDDVVVWTGAAGTTAWENPANWSTSALPQPGQDVQITTGDVVLSSTAQIGRLTQVNERDDPPLTFTIAAGGHLRLDASADKEIHVSSVTSEKTVIENGGDASTAAGGPHLWELPGFLELKGGHVLGFLTLDNTGTCSVSGGGGFGPNTTVNNRGDAAKARAAGLLQVTAGTFAAAGRVVNEGDVVIPAGTTLQVTGRVENQPGGLVTLTGDLTGTGTLANLGTVERTGAGTSIVAVAVENQRDAAAGAITIAQGTWQATGAFTNDGVLTVASGTTLARAGLVDNGPDGIVLLRGNVSGAGALANAGLVQRSDAGTSIVAGVLRNVFDASTGRAGQTTVAAGTLAAARLENDGVTLVAAGATLDATGQLINGAQGRLAGGGTIDVAGASFSNLGRVTPGASPGILAFTGDYTSGATTRLMVELGGTTPGSGHDQLAVGGAATLSGALHATLVGGFMPIVGDSFTVVTAAAVSANFTCTSGLQLGPQLALVPVVRPGRLVLITRAINVANDPPVAVADTVVVAGSGPVALTPQANDQDPDGDDLTLVAITSGPASGRAYLASDGRALVYVAPSSPPPSDTLTYAVTDCAGATATAQVVIRFGNATDTPPPALVPAQTALHAAAPNPFNPVTRIRWDVARPGPVRVTVHDLRGRRVRTLASGHHDAGTFTADWRGDDDAGRTLAAGVYVVRLEAPGRVDARKVTLLK